MARPRGRGGAGVERVEGLDISQELRCNERIRISPIRLIDHEGNQAGIVDTREAIGRAREAGLDLVEVAPQSRPPVCRIMDYGKWKYAQSKKERKAHSSKGAELKEVRIRTPKIGQHDLEIKINHAREFLARGDRVQFILQMRGRELAHADLARQLLGTVKTKLADVAKIERDIGSEGRALSMLFSPSAVKVPAKPKPAQAKPQTPKPAAPAGQAAPAASAPADGQATAPVPAAPAAAPEPAPAAQPAPPAAGQ